MEESNIIWFAIVNDWPVLIPIVICSFILVAVVIDRMTFYNRNKRDVVRFIQQLQRELGKGNLTGAQMLSTQVGGVIGDVAEEGLRVLSEQPAGFDRAFDITSSLARRKLEARLSAIGTIATIAPYLGLFATVFRILLTFGEMANSQAATQAPEIMFGIGSALIATALGLALAILAVTLNNWFQATVYRYEDDFQLLKLLFLSFSDVQSSAAVPGGYRQG